MHEVLPIVAGFVLGGLLASIRLPVFLRVPLIVIIGVSATIGSGEFRVSWSYLIPDIFEVTFAACIGFFFLKSCRSYLARRH